jgi:hypothetical protein
MRDGIAALQRQVREVPDGWCVALERDRPLDRIVTEA